MVSEATAQATEDAFLRARIDAVYALNLPMIAMDMLGCSLIVWFNWRPDTTFFLGVWIIANAALAVPRIAIALAYLLGRFPSVRLQSWAMSLVVFAGIAGVMWGAVLAWLVPTGSDNQVMFMMCVALSGLTLSIANVGYWPVYAAFAAPVTLASALGFAISARPGGAILSFGAVMLTIALLGTSRQLARQILRSQKLAVTNQALVESLGERGRELEQACRVLEEVSRTDPLTGLANRRSCDARLATEWDRAVRLGRTLGVIAIDVDHFKKYNDTHGHAAGDRCLQALAQILANTTRGPIDLAARPGGEEFLLILPAIEAGALASIAERVRVAIATRTGNGDFDLPERITVSLGVALAEPATDMSIQTLTQAADAALYRAKQGGRNRYEISDPFAKKANAAA